MKKTTNLKAAMAKELETTLKDMAVPTGTTEDGAPSDKQVIIRCTESEREYWKKAAEAKGITFSEFARKLLNETSINILECNHPINRRRFYPWAEICTDCGHRFRG